MLDVSILVIVFGPLTSVSLAEWHSDSGLHYGFSVPEGWMEIPKLILDETFGPVAKRLGVKAPNFETGFQVRSEHYLRYPYVLVQHLPSDSATIRQIASGLSDLDNTKAVKTLRNSEVFHDLSFAKPTVDKFRKMILYMTEINVQGSGLVKVLNVVVPGRSGSVLLLFYSLDDDYVQHLPSFQFIIDSFKFEEGHEYNWAAAATKSWSFIWKGAGEKAIIGAVTGAIVGICVVPIVLLKRRGSRSSDSQT
jgi:hypothetical protein